MKTNRTITNAEVDDITHEFKFSSFRAENMIGDELLRVYMLLPDSLRNGTKTAIDSMDNIIRAARLARTKLRRLL